VNLNFLGRSLVPSGEVWSSEEQQKVKGLLYFEFTGIVFWTHPHELLLVCPESLRDKAM